MKYSFIVNPLSKGGRTLQWFESHRHELKNTLSNFEVLLTKEARHATQLTANALKNGSDIIVSVGGDGTHHEVVNGFFDKNGQHIAKDSALALINSGTGGDFVRSLEQSKKQKFKDSLALLTRNKRQKISIGRIDYINHDDQNEMSYFLNVASLGLSGEVDKIVNSSSKRFGVKTTFLSATLKAFANYKAPLLKIKIDGQDEYVTKIQLLALCNGQYFGGGMRLAPQASPQSNKMNLVQVKDEKAIFWIKNIAKVYSGKHKDLKEIKMKDITSINISVDQKLNKPVLIDVDGEQLGKLPIKMEVLPQALNLII